MIAQLLCITLTMAERRRSSVVSVIGQAFPAVVKDPVLSVDSNPSSTKEDFVRHDNAGHTFDTSSADEDYYKPIDTYEGRHRYDPKFEWTAKEEKRLVRRIDYRICSWVTTMLSSYRLLS